MIGVRRHLIMIGDPHRLLDTTGPQGISPILLIGLPSSQLRLMASAQRAAINTFGHETKATRHRYYTWAARWDKTTRTLTRCAKEWQPL
jgi:hypothetical protein